MEEQNTLPAPVLAACEIAATDAQPVGAPIEVVAAHKDVNARGKVREWWYRLVWRQGTWQYLGERRLSAGTFLARDRYQTVHAEVWPGEIIVRHDRGGPIEAAWLVADDGLLECDLGRTREGKLRITLPDGREVVRPNPRR